MRKLALSITLAVVCQVAWAQDEWIYAASNNDKQWHFKSGTLEETETKAGVNIVTVLGKVTDTKNSQITVGKWYVSLEDCSRQLGKLVTLDINGNFRFDNDFVFGSGSVASSLAELICAAYQLRLDEKNKRSI